MSSKSEVGASIVQAALQARGESIAQTSNKAPHLEKYLSDQAVAELYRTVYKAVKEED
ncbi:hypothetical protein MKX40_17960 [Paenibacillus sp. FSL R5-0517]|uniref:hypothetical protein n=1 Tax=Paenibacillus sp. FSL R5-0517 TaxID=2921647 RepID=UPI0030DD4253